MQAARIEEAPSEIRKRKRVISRFKAPLGLLPRLTIVTVGVMVAAVEFGTLGVSLTSRLAEIGMLAAVIIAFLGSMLGWSYLDAKERMVDRFARAMAGAALRFLLLQLVTMPGVLVFGFLVVVCASEVWGF